MKKVLFLDRDGTLILEPSDYQVDDLSKVQYYPKVFRYLSKIVEELDYEVVMITNQDGLGTDSYPEDTFWPAQNKMLKTLEGEGIFFDEIFIDKTFEHENAETRKPRTGLLTKYFSDEYDMSASYVIGDRWTDIILAENLGANGIQIADTPSDSSNHLALYTTDWDKIYDFLKMPQRIAEVKRTTKETDIFIKLNLDGTGKTDITTGLGFFDHMLDQIGKHSNTDLEIKVKGDLHIDEHHTIEDTALALGECFLKAIGDKKGVYRYGFLLPMDECLAQVAIDFGGRPWFIWDAEFKREKIGEMPTEMFYHFFKSFSDTAKCNLNMKVEGDNEHHKIEALFKGLAKAIKMAVTRDKTALEVLPSTKGVL